MSSQTTERPIVIATRGSALALTQSRYVQARLEGLLPNVPFEIKIFKTTGDQLQSRPPEEIPASLPKGLFTKELEVALLNGTADLAVHSLKDLPTELPEGLKIAGVSPREDVREVLLTKKPLEGAKEDGNLFRSFPDHSKIGTGSPRRQAFVRIANPSLQTIPIRGNVPTRIKKLAESNELDGIILAAAGLKRLGYVISEQGPITGNDVPDSIFAKFIPIKTMIPCVGQGAIGLETRSNDSRIQAICDQFTHQDTRICVETERAFLMEMGGGCQSPVAGYATIENEQIHMLAANVGNGQFKETEGKSNLASGTSLAKELAKQIK
jgi:hydroxymethylbilane synthase